VRLVKEGERWLMHVGSRRAGARRRDFASPHLEHAIRAAEQWYGAVDGGWREEKGKQSEAQDLPSQESIPQRDGGGRSQLDLDGA
jgi:hypothetical protein